jgi:hypothetical protein
MDNQYENLPYQLRSLRLFCCWRYEDRIGKKTKVPYNPVTNKRAKPDRPDTFNDFNTALMAVNNYDGIGFLVGNDIYAVDLDDCFDSTGNLKTIAQSIVDEFSGCYMEYSPSGKGLHIYFKAGDFRYDKTKYYINNQKIGVEVYVSGVTNHFMTVTGNVYCNGDLLEKRDVLRAILDKYMLRPKPMMQSIIIDSQSYLSDESVVEKASILGNYGLCGDTRYECLSVLYGATTRNGKGTLCESILKVLGSYGCTARPETISLKINIPFIVNNMNGIIKSVFRNMKMIQLLDGILIQMMKR